MDVACDGLPNTTSRQPIASLGESDVHFQRVAKSSGGRRTAGTKNLRICCIVDLSFVGFEFQVMHRNKLKFKSRTLMNYLNLQMDRPDFGGRKPKGGLAT